MESFFEGLNFEAGAPIFIPIDIICFIFFIRLGSGTTGASSTFPVPITADASTEPSCAVALS
jgi:hypothetical protein